VVRSRDATVQIAPGTVLADKYRVDRMLGEGGMGVVLAATHLQLRQKIAVKLLRPEAMANPSLIERFEREARAAARVHGEHVARVIDVGKLAGGLPYIVMEYLEGEDLERTLTRRGPLPVEEIVDYLLQTCEAVGEAHAANIVHRDLKPANLFLATRPNHDVPIVKVLDFGISKILEPETDAITRTSALMGTAYYMSPEQLTSAKKVDTRTDIWALGVILYELLAAKRPFEAGTMPEVVALILENSPTPLQTLRTDVPDGLVAVIGKCLRKMDDRYQTVADLANALEPFAPQHARSLVTRVNKLVKPSLQMPVPSSANAPQSGREQHRIAVDTEVDFDGQTAVMGVTQPDPVRSEPAPAPTPKTEVDAPPQSMGPRSVDAKKRRGSSSTVIGLGVLAFLTMGGLAALYANKNARPDEGHPLVGTMGSTGSAALAVTIPATPTDAESVLGPASAAPSAAPSNSVRVPSIPIATGKPHPLASGNSAVGVAVTTSTGVKTAPSASAGPRNPLDMGPLK